MTKPSSTGEEFRALFRDLTSMGPASNLLTRMLFTLPEKARILFREYPELMENEDSLLTLFNLEYGKRGFLDSYEGLGYHLKGLYRSLFSLLSDPESRRKLLELAGLSEEEFRDIDPLRAWLRAAIKYLAEAKPSSLRLLSFVLKKLEESEEVLLGEGLEEELGKLDVEFEVDLEILKRFGLLYQENPFSIRRRECPLMLDAYSDIRVEVD